MKTTHTGTLYGIGVGPGDPELIPIKAVRILAAVDVVFTAASTRNDYSRALEIVRPHLPDQVGIDKLDFPMSKDHSVMEEAWRRHAAHIAEVLEGGKEAAFLTLGDPLTYSTYGYILRHLRAEWPDMTIVTIPGITSYQAAAAAVNQPLVEGEESLLILSGVHGGHLLRETLQTPDNVVFLKAYRDVGSIRAALQEAGLSAGSLAVTHCSTAQQQVHLDLNELAAHPPNYWTLILAKRNTHGFKR